MSKRLTKAGATKPPHPGDLITTIRTLAKWQKVTFTKHALDRLDQRDLDISDVFEVLRLGDIDGVIESGKRDGEWSCLVVGKLKWSPREVGAATVVVRGERLIITTVEWIDP